MPLCRLTALPSAAFPALVAIVLTAASGCTDGGGDDQVASRPSRFTPTAPVTGLGTVGLDCMASIEDVDDPPESYTEVLSAVAVPSGDRTLQLSPSDNSGNRQFAKQGLVIRVGRGVELSVPGDAAERPAISWGDLEAPVSVITVAPCPARPDTKQWLAFAGGFYVERPMCVPLTIRTASDETTVHVPVGMPCSG